jgi:molybdate transport system substrate-binding protein
LQQQIEQGAPVDIFMSAATKQMDALKNKNLLMNDTIKNLLENNVVLVVP